MLMYTGKTPINERQYAVGSHVVVMNTVVYVLFSLGLCLSEYVLAGFLY